MKSAITEVVTDERWQAAQAWEREHWVRTQHLRAKFGKNLIWKLLSNFGLVSRHRGDDWNQWWKKQFDDYAFLPPVVHNALEVGCGPYTNVRLMLNRCRFEHLFLSDPLIRTYAKFKLTFVADMYKNVSCMLDDHGLEDIPFVSDYFDLVVMINVLDHVRDARKCMDNAVRLVRSGGGILIIGQDLTNEEDLAAMKDDGGAIGHPIKLDHTWFDPYLKEFKPIIHKVLDRKTGRAPEHHYGNLIFSGRKA